MQPDPFSFLQRGGTTRLVYYDGICQQVPHEQKNQQVKLIYPTSLERLVGFKNKTCQPHPEVNVNVGVESVPTRMENLETGIYLVTWWFHE